MFKITIAAFFAILACAAAKPGVIAPLAYSAPLLAGPAGIVTATSNQIIARNYNGIASAPLLAAAAAPIAVAAPLAAAPIAVAPSFGLASAAYTAPLSYAAAYNYAATPFAARYISPLGSLGYAAAPAQYLI